MRFLLLLSLQGPGVPCLHPKARLGGVPISCNRKAVFMLGAMTLLGCGGEVAGPEAPAPVDEPGQRVGSLVLSAEADTIWLTETTQLHATVLGTDGDTLVDEAISYTSANESIITVSSTGLATAVGPGSAAVTARAGEGSATVVLFAAGAAITLVSGDGQTGDIGKPLGQPFVVRVTDAQGEGIGGVGVTWSTPSGKGDFLPLNRITEAVAHSETDDEGFASMEFSPRTIGLIGVVAAAEREGVKGSPATYTITGVFVLSDLPPFSGSPLIYESVGADSQGRHSTYILNEDRTFEMEFSDGFNPMGTFSLQNDVIVFDFGANELGTGTLREDSLRVTYNFEALIDGFEDAVYVRVP